MTSEWSVAHAVFLYNFLKFLFTAFIYALLGLAVCRLLAQDIVVIDIISALVSTHCCFVVAAVVDWYTW